jgi:hypothetical protein
MTPLLASHELHSLSATAMAPEWIQQIPYAGLAPESFHMLEAKPASLTLIKMDDLPLLVSGHYGKGKTFAYMGFSPESTERTPHDPFILDRAVQGSPEGRLFATISATILALASADDPSTSIEEVIEQRQRPLFETLLKKRPLEAPHISTTWTSDSDGRAVGHIRIENGGEFTFGFHLRMDGADEYSGRTLPLWSEQYFDLPHEVAEDTVTLWQGDTGNAKPSWIIAETMAGAETKYPGPAASNLQP